MVKEITNQELQHWLSLKKPIQLIDVRSKKEHLAGHLANDIHIPVGDIVQECDSIAEDKTVVIYCRSGIRSYEAVRLLQEEIDHPALFNLKRGILGWKGGLVFGQ